MQGFEELMTHTNVLNRKLEEVYGVGKEFTTVADLWGKFNALIREQQVSRLPVALYMDTSVNADSEGGVMGLMDGVD